MSSHESRRHKSQTDQRAQVSEHIAVPRVESRTRVFPARSPGANSWIEPRRRIRDPAARSDVSADPGVRDAQHLAIVLDRTKDRIREMLSHDRRRSQIAIVRNIYEHVGPFVHKRPRDSRMRGLDANKNPGAQVAEGHQRVRTAGRKIADDSTYRTCARKPVGQRHVLAKRHQADFIILRHNSTLFIYQDRRIVFAGVWGWLEGIEQHGGVIGSSERRDRGAQLRVARVTEVHWRLGPDDQTCLCITVSPLTKTFQAKLEMPIQKFSHYRGIVGALHRHVGLYGDDKILRLAAELRFGNDLDVS